ncbi:hypothetical protein DV736_g5909, partial [Chaetothyriales sp. CBS 134916]
MKYLVFAATVTAVAASSPHHHKHAHLHERGAVYTKTDVVATATIFQANGTPISKDEACCFINFAIIDFFPGVDFRVVNFFPIIDFVIDRGWFLPGIFVILGEHIFLVGGIDCSLIVIIFRRIIKRVFLDCDTFPSEYGPIALDYLGLGGWAGIQSVTWGADAITDIVTGVSGNTCQEGDMCSYACPPGYQKSQWPSTQGATGQSVGGIQCSGGKLRLTNSALSSSLCIPGVGGVTATNNADEVVAICRTDYPGTESETIPVELQPGETQQLAVPDASSYFIWEGKPTSAQYYLNPPGYSAAEACQWGSAGTPIGNFAPTNFGVGYSAGKIWLSIFPNTPTTDVSYPGSVEIQGDNLSGSCKYSNGQFESDTGSSSTGCTVAVVSGSAVFVIS